MGGQWVGRYMQYWADPKQLIINPGDEGNLNVSVQAYTPPFTKCEGAPPARRPNHEACQTIINIIMKASTVKTTFAAFGVPIQREPVERLPQTFVARKIHISNLDTVATCAYEESSNSWGWMYDYHRHYRTRGYSFMV